MHSAFQADKVRVRFPLPAPLTSTKGPKMKLPIDEKDPALADFLSQVLRLASSEAVITLELAVDGDTRLRVVSDSTSVKMAIASDTPVSEKDSKLLTTVVLAALTRRIGAGKQLPEELQEEEGK